MVEYLYLVATQMNENTNRIAVLSSTRIGDFVAMIPSLVKLRKSFPDSQITLITWKIEAPELVMEYASYFHEIIETGRGRFRRFSILLNILYLRRKRFDYLIFGLPPNKLSDLICYTLINAKKKFRYLGAKDINASEMWLNTLGQIGIEVGNGDRTFPPIFQYRMDDYDKIDSILNHANYSTERILVGVHMFPIRDWETKSWDSARWIRLIKYLHITYNPLVIFFGGEYEVPQTIKIIEKLNFEILNLTGKFSLRETSLMLEKLYLLVCINSGIMNLASALNVPHVCLSGPSSRMWQPFGIDSMEVRKTINRKHCNPPCNRQTCWWKDNQCMNHEVSDVINAIEQVI